MAKRFLIFLIASFIILPACAFAEETFYTFNDVHLSVQLPGGAYDVVLTRDSLASNEAFLSGQGLTAETAAVQFQTEGVLLKAYDQTNGRTLILSAQKDAEAEQYFNINEHTPEVRAGYRRLHAAGEFYRSQGYTYTSVEWKNFRGIGRWLMLKYDFRKEGSVEHRGYQRRTIYNGYTITVDMQSNGDRALKPADNSALNKVFDTISFTSTEAMPELPVMLIEKNTAPAETSEPTFIMSGTTAPLARLTAVIGSFSTAQTQVIESTAKKNGAYSFTVTLPQEDMYFMTLTVESDQAKTLERQYAITYRKGLMKVSMTSTPPEKLEQDSVRIAGTAEKGARVQLEVNGKATTKKIGEKGTFVFHVDTSAEGDYSFVVTVTKDGFETRTFSYKGERKLTEADRTARITEAAQSPTYRRLTRNIDKYDGKTLMYEGYVVSAENKGGEWVMQFALTSVGDNYSEFFIVTSDGDPKAAPGTKVTLFGTLVGTGSIVNPSGNEAEYPKLQLLLIKQP